MAVIPVIVCIGARSADPGRSCVGKRRGLSFNTSVLVIVISDQRRAFSGPVIRGSAHFPGTRYKFVERRQNHPDIIGVRRRRRGKRYG